MSAQIENNVVSCPVCNREFQSNVIEEHVNKCLFLNNRSEVTTVKRSGSYVGSVLPLDKKIKLSPSHEKPVPNRESMSSSSKDTQKTNTLSEKVSGLPLAEQMRPIHLDDLVGQDEAFGTGSMLRSLLERKQVPNMILWGPPGCGKTSLANIVATICKEQGHLRFVKLSATMSGINDVKEVVKVAKNEAQFKRRTILFMDEIHRFNKLQQDTFLPHVENGTITLIGATTENPSFSLNNALLSRCRVVVMEKLSSDNVMIILERTLKKNKEVLIVDPDNPTQDNCNNSVTSSEGGGGCGVMVERPSLRWLADVCDGDARVALAALELALAAIAPQTGATSTLTLQHIQDGIKRSHMLYDRAGEEHYNTVSALHKAVRAGHDNAALYWCTRALHAGEDPRYIARRLVRAAAEDIGLADPLALVEAVSVHQGCQLLGAPECDVLLAQCAVRLARAGKSTEVYSAMQRCKRALSETRGPLPPVPLHLRNAPTTMMKQLGYGHGYNTLPHDKSGLTYMPEGMENVNFFKSPSFGNSM